MSVEVTTIGGTIVSASTGSRTSVSLTSSSTSISVASPTINSVNVTSNPSITDHDHLRNIGTLTHAQLEAVVELNTAKVTDRTYFHNQGVASSLWIVTHNLNKYPSVSVTDSAGTVVIGMVDYDSLNTVKLTFKAAFSGKAHFN